jgi:hypothetical protein
MERFYYGEFAAATAAQSKTRASGPTRYAEVLKEPILDLQKFGETVAVNRGMLVKAFDTLDEALKWLEKFSPDNPGDGVRSSNLLLKECDHENTRPMNAPSQIPHSSF